MPGIIKSINLFFDLAFVLYTGSCLNQAVKISFLHHDATRMKNALSKIHPKRDLNKI